MKKITCLGMTLVLAIGLMACGNKPAETKAPETQAQTETEMPETQAQTETEAAETETTAPETETTAPETETTAPETEAADTNAVESTPAETTVPDESAESVAESETAYEGVGVWDGNTYTCEMLGMTMTFPENWAIAAPATELGATTQEFIVANMDNGMDSVALLLEDLVVQGVPELIETEYLEVIKTQLSSNEKMTVSDEIGEVVIGDRTFYTMHTSVAESGLYQTYYFHKVDEKMATIIMTATSEDVLNEIFGYISAI